MFIKPSRPDLIVRDPRSKKPLPVNGAEKPESTYWIRRLVTGDVVMAEKPVEVEAAE